MAKSLLLHFNSMSEELNELTKLLEKEGYFNIREIPTRGICGLSQFSFTCGLVIQMDEESYQGRYCYATLSEAKEAIENWNGEGDPPGNWIKYKGVGGDRSRK